MAVFNGENYTQHTNLNVTDTLRVGGNIVGAQSLVVVNSAEDLSGPLDSTKQYLIDGIIDMGSQSIEVPVGGLNIIGFDFDVSKLFSSENNYDMFTSPVGGSGDLLRANYEASVTGTNSKVYNIVSANGTEAFESERLTYRDCTSLGSVENYATGLEVGNRRFGGKPSLELIGAWDSYRITPAIVRNIDDTMAEALFVAGVGFTMSSRFLTDINADLGALAPLVDFASSNFPNPSTLQIIAALIVRNGVANPDDATLTPNISPSDLASNWIDNQGLKNTFVGGEETITSEALTTISTINTLVDVAGTWTAGDLQHFDSPANGQLRHLGSNPREYVLIGDIVVEGTQGNSLTLQITVRDVSEATDINAGRQIREVNNLAGGRNVAFFNINKRFTLDKNDFVKLQIENNSGTDNVTAELDSSSTVSAR